MSSHDYEVGEAADGHAALDAFAERKPDLVVLDWHLPELSGIETCRALRHSSVVPIIMVSANRLNTKRMALEGGRLRFSPQAVFAQ